MGSTQGWAGYSTITVVLIAFGLLAVVTFGLPFLLLGVGLLLLAPLWSRRHLFRPAVAGLVAFVGTWTLISPWGCRLEAVEAGGRTSGSMTCFSLLGLRYAASGNYEPSQWPAIVAGLVAAAVVVVIFSVVIGQHRNAATSS